ncbi:MAG TPA: YMGG-like glycine zipper-containing protein [Stellaceae bacterium]|nr:YMGG-like glycine zipper-containing protein [Stellaceae bacterium]
MKLVYRRIAGAVAATVGLAACVQTPSAPTIPVSPGPNKTFETFAVDQAACQQYAAAQTAPAVAAANNQEVGGALLTTALGAGLGAAVSSGGWHSHTGRGAGIGAASGAAAGTLWGASQAGPAQMSIQQQYDIMYGECMAAHGNSVPAFSPPPGTPPYAGSPSAYPGGPSPYPGGPSPYPGGSPYSGGPSPYYGGPPPAAPGGASYPGAPVPPPSY